jgi:dienelactone hydrolase
VRTVPLLALPALLLLAALPSAADELPYPPGQSIQQLEGLKTVLVLPDGLDAAKPASLVVILHGAGGSATGMAGSFAPWAQDGYVVCAPKAADQTWEPDDLKRTLRICAHLKEVLPIDPKKVHVVGFSNGGWNLHPLAFDEDLRPCSATWVAAGFQGGQVPKWAKTELAVLAMAGSDDPNVRAARDTVPVLRDKVRSVEVQVQQGLDHKYPRELVDYHRWWMGVQDGRLTPGDDRGFRWTEDLDAAIATQAGVKKGGVLVWLYTQHDAESDVARHIQHTALFDAEVRFLAGQIPCVKLDVTEDATVLERLGVKQAPALVVLDKQGKTKKTYEGEFKVSKLARTLRGVAPKRTMPK